MVSLSFGPRFALWVLLSASSCGIVVNQGSNDLDGSVCPEDAGTGISTLEGPASFAVLSSYQRRQTLFLSDGGEGGSWLTFTLSNRDLSCGETPDSGTTYPFVVAYLFDGNSTLGTYSARPDGGMGALIALHTPFFNGGQLTQATSGGFELTQVTSCALSGFLDAGFELEDGGATWLRGPVNAVYCRTPR